MARRQAPLEGDGPVVRFAIRLREARESAGLTLRELAKISGYSHSTLSLAESGRRLPSWQVAGAFLQACGQQDVGRYRGLWEAAAEYRAELAESLSPPPAPADPNSQECGEPEKRVAPQPRDPSGLRRTCWRRGAPWWLVISACVVSSALTAGGFLLFPPGSSEARQQAIALDSLLKDSRISSLAYSAVEQIKSCQNLDGARHTLREAANRRNALLTRLGEIYIDRLPHHEQLNSSLVEAWMYSAEADNRYANWADDLAITGGCRNGSAYPDSGTTAGNAATGQAITAKQNAANLWNPIAKKYALTQYTVTDL